MLLADELCLNKSFEQRFLYSRDVGILLTLRTLVILAVIAEEHRDSQLEEVPLSLVLHLLFCLKLLIIFCLSLSISLWITSKI